MKIDDFKKREESTQVEVEGDTDAVVAVRIGNGTKDVCEAIVGS